jgi:uncharacterized membrane protein
MASRRRGIALWIVGTLFLAAGIHYATILIYPRALMAYVEHKLLKKGKKNEVGHGSRPTPEDRDVVAPCPDLIYSVCVFDVSETPLRITAPLTGSYMSLSFYADNSDNFFVMNDREVEGGKFDVILAGPAADDISMEGVRAVRAPSATGILLFRYFAGQGSNAEEIVSRQKQIECTPLPVRAQ